MDHHGSQGPTVLPSYESGKRDPVVSPRLERDRIFVSGEYGARRVRSGQEQRHERQRGTCGIMSSPLGQLLPRRARRRDTRPMVPSFDNGKGVWGVSAKTLAGQVLLRGLELVD
jgi:hypothetical protein